MDISTIIGLGVAFASVSLAIIIGGDPLSLINIPAIIVVVGGSLGAVIAAFPLAQSTKLPKLVMKAVMGTSPDPGRTIRDIVKFAEIARREGILSLENHVEDLDDEFMVRGIKMAVDGTDPELIREIMDTELETLMDRHRRARWCWISWPSTRPAFGMIGTLWV